MKLDKLSREIIETRMETNPYAPPSEPAQPVSSENRSVFVRGEKKGPALYIVTCGLLGALVGVAFLIRYNPIGFAFVFGGCICGGFVYRIRSRHWPTDPNARNRQLKYSVAAVTVIPAMVHLFTGFPGDGWRTVLIGLIVGIAITSGILVSGTRRHQKAS